MSMKAASDNPHLQGRIIVLLDGRDVTKDCTAFDVQAGQVTLRTTDRLATYSGRVEVIPISREDTDLRA